MKEFLHTLPNVLQDIFAEGTAIATTLGASITKGKLSQYTVPA